MFLSVAGLWPCTPRHRLQRWVRHGFSPCSVLLKPSFQKGETDVRKKRRQVNSISREFAQDGADILNAQRQVNSTAAIPFPAYPDAPSDIKPTVQISHRILYRIFWFIDHIPGKFKGCPGIPPNRRFSFHNSFSTKPFDMKYFKET